MESTRPEPANALAWPTSQSPTRRNLERALALCADSVGATPSSGVVTPFSSGWSSQDCIKVDFPSQSFVVKFPRRASASDVSVCKAEAIRTSWAAEHSTGPRVYATDDETGAFAMECIQGRTLSHALAMENLHRILQLLIRIHSSPKQRFMAIYNPIDVVTGYLSTAKASKTMLAGEIDLIELVLEKTKRQIGKFHSYTSALVPCHNDFHSQNILLESISPGKIRAIDFENCDVGDAMWDLGYLTVDLELERTPMVLADLYGASEADRARLAVYVPLALAHCATWTANNGQAWMEHHDGLMKRLREVTD